MEKQVINYPVELALAIIGDKWKILILCQLYMGTRRFSELFRAINNINQKMLTQQLRSLEQDGLISRKVYAEVPPKVEYSLTSLGRSLNPVIEAMFDWAMENKESFIDKFNIKIESDLKYPHRND